MAYLSKDSFDLGKELASIDFESMIGGPLCAVIKAQNQAAILTASFIKEFGFQKNTNNGGSAADPVMVEFQYDKPGLFGMPTKTKLRVPFLTMIPIPSLRIEEVHIEFLAKITSMQSVAIEESEMKMSMGTDTSSSTSEGKSSDRGGWWSNWRSENKTTSARTSSLMTATTNQRQTKTGATITKDFSLKVVVRAVQDELPAGIDRILSILEGQIKEDTGQKDLLKMMGAGNLGSALGGATGGGTPTTGTSGTSGTPGGTL